MLRNHPGFQLLESEQVKLLGVCARPLEHDVLLRPERHYFLVALPRPIVPPRRAWSGALHVGAREMLQSLMLTRRSTSGDRPLLPNCAGLPALHRHRGRTSSAQYAPGEVESRRQGAARETQDLLKLSSSV
ncbi:hypothetical protein CFC21_104681 [Triticum aestivum]|uniref:Uncharacterized protein n=2 Tax=Triticum aestivum TaxID=4565 RepID=A0A3B6SIB5_WHEAT|nr:hypothetical protein CFC21_104681 [Triticum aestivum]